MRVACEPARLHSLRSNKHRIRRCVTVDGDAPRPKAKGAHFATRHRPHSLDGRPVPGEAIVACADGGGELGRGRSASPRGRPIATFRWRSSRPLATLLSSPCSPPNRVLRMAHGARHTEDDRPRRNCAAGGAPRRLRAFVLFRRLGLHAAARRRCCCCCCCSLASSCCGDSSRQWPVRPTPTRMTRCREGP